MSADLRSLGDEISDHELAVVILDPLYLGLLAGAQDLQASNLYHIGPLLSAVSQACLKAGATPILAHHTKKQVANPYSPPELEDLAFAGVQEFARQWLLIGRREQFQPGTGDHRLWLNVGRSAGHSGCWAVDINEGQLGEDFSGRTWLVEVRAATDERQAAGERREQERQEERREREQHSRQRVIDALGHYTNGATFTQLRESAGLSSAKARPALDALLAEGVVEAVEVQRRCGRGIRAQGGFRLADLVDEWDTDEVDGDEEDEGEEDGE